MPKLSLIPASIALVGVIVFLYPAAASWVNQYNQSAVVDTLSQKIGDADPDAREQLKLAHEYNRSLRNGAVLVEYGNVPIQTGQQLDSALHYNAMLNVDNSGLMGRIRIPSIDVDLPIYHGTTDETLLQGVGHLEGTSLPVGGEGQRTVLTAHRGLAEARMFTDLNLVQEDDLFTVEVMGEVLTYRVFETQVVEADDRTAIDAVAGKDLATLVTCTPLGVNSHRILVTGERVTPTPASELGNAMKPSEQPGFPWWLVWVALAIAIVSAYVWREGRVLARQKHPQISARPSGEPTGSA